MSSKLIGFALSMLHWDLQMLTFRLLHQQLSSLLLLGALAAAQAGVTSYKFTI